LNLLGRSRAKPFINAGPIGKYVFTHGKEDLSLPLIQVSGSDKGVNLLTAHGSKGLEFEYVFAGCNA
jgi:DNA helicase-2/ATP-dependent DNA helicase PcrA